MADQPTGDSTQDHAGSLSGRAKALYLRLRTVAGLIREAPPVAGPALLWRDSTGVVQACMVKGTILIGRDDACDLVFTHPQVSRRHCRVHLSDSEVWIEDLGSTHGTIVSGMAVRQQTLRDGDLIDLSGAALAYVAGK